MQVRIYLISRKGRCSRYNCKRKNDKGKIRFEYVRQNLCTKNPVCEVKI